MTATRKVEVYAFEDRDGYVYEFTTCNVDEARGYAQIRGLKWLARTYEYTDTELVADYTDQAREECAYCGADVLCEEPPPEDDEAAWARIAQEHDPDCEWVLTRAHRRRVQVLEEKEQDTPGRVWVLVTVERGILADPCVFDDAEKAEAAYKKASEERGLFTEEDRERAAHDQSREVLLYERLEVQ
jgi:hypothetical protein